LINTDYRVERVLGNCFFPTTGTIAHQAAWSQMQRYDDSFLKRYISRRRQYLPKVASELAKARVVLPELTLGSELTLHKGDKVLQLLHAGGQTPGSILVHVPEDRVLFAGDVVVVDQHPALDQANTERWLEALEAIRNMDDVDVIVPGHGAPCTADKTRDLTRYITAMRERVHEQFEAGLTRRETVDKVKMSDLLPIPADRRTLVERRIRGSVERVYGEFKKGPQKRRR
jgi:cyclase